MRQSDLFFSSLFFAFPICRFICSCVLNVFLVNVTFSVCEQVNTSTGALIVRLFTVRNCSYHKFDSIWLDFEYTNTHTYIHVFIRWMFNVVWLIDEKKNRERPFKCIVQETRAHTHITQWRASSSGNHFGWLGYTFYGQCYSQWHLSQWKSIQCVKQKLQFEILCVFCSHPPHTTSASLTLSFLVLFAIFSRFYGLVCPKSSEQREGESAWAKLINSIEVLFVVWFNISKWK